LFSIAHEMLIVVLLLLAFDVFSIPKCCWLLPLQRRTLKPSKKVHHYTNNYRHHSSDKAMAIKALVNLAGWLAGLLAC